MRRRVVLWTVSGVAGAVVFWLVQVLAGGPTIPEFLGAQIVAVGGYPASLEAPIGWAVHLAVSFSYALLFGVVALLLRGLPPLGHAALTLIVALGLGWVTTLIAPPAISVTIALLGGRGWPDELFPLNTEWGLPFWNHLIFFLLSWVLQALGARGGKAAARA